MEEENECRAQADEPGELQYTQVPRGSLEGTMLLGTRQVVTGERAPEFQVRHKMMHPAHCSWREGNKRQTGKKCR